MKKIRIFFAALCCLLAAGSVWAGDTLSVGQRRRFEYAFLEGVRLRLAEQYSQSYHCFRRCLEINPNSADALVEMANYNLYALGNDSLGMEQLRLAAKQQPQNPYHLEQLVQAYVSHDDYEQAIPVLEQIVTLQPKRLDMLSALTRLYIGRDDSRKALHTLERIELLRGKSLEVSMNKYMLLKNLKKNKQAYAEMEDLRRSMPHDLNIPLVMANLYLEDGKEKKALELMQQVEQESPHYPQLMLAKIDYYERKGLDSLSHALCDSMVFSHNVDTETRLSMLARRMDELKQENDSLASAMTYHRRVVAQFPDPQLYNLSARFLIDNKAPADSINAELRRLLELDPTNLAALSALLMNSLERENMDETEEMCLRGINVKPEELRFSYILGGIYSQRQRYADAVEVLKSGIQRGRENARPDALSDAYAMLGDCYYACEQPQQAFEAYDSALVCNPQNIMCQNNYAYYLSLRGEQLDKAERMSYQTIKAEPLNKTYLDTYAWVLFRNDNPSMAKFYIDRVVSPSATDEEILMDVMLSPDVLRHAADIYAANELSEKSKHYRLLADMKETLLNEQEQEDKTE